MPKLLPRVFQMSNYKKNNNKIPKHWRWITLGELAIVGPNNGVFKRRQEFGSGVRLLNVADLYKSLKLNVSNLERVRVTDSEITKYEILKGDLFFCRSSLKREGIGWCCYADEINEPTVFECHVMRIRPNPKIADSKFIAYYWQHPDVRNEIITKAKTATMTTMNQRDLSEVIIPLPPLPEQKRIAEVLDKADALREKRRLALQKLDMLLQSVFLEMFGDPVKNPKGWDVGNIESIVSERSDIRCGPFGTQLKVDELVDKGIPLFGIENVHTNKFVGKTKKFVTEQKARYLSAFSVNPKDVLVTRMGTIGRACVVPESILNGIISYHLFRVRPNPLKCLPEFLASTICRSGTFQTQLKMFSHGAIMDGLSTANLKNVKFLIPPIELQKKYVDFVQKTEATILKLEASKESFDNLFQSLQQRAFKGELFSDESPTVNPQEEKAWQQISLS